MTDSRCRRPQQLGCAAWFLAACAGIWIIPTGCFGRGCGPRHSEGLAGSSVSAWLRLLLSELEMRCHLFRSYFGRK